MDRYGELERILKQLTDLVRQIPLGTAVELLRDLGLLKGIEDEGNLQFIRRLQEAPDQKERIAEYLTRKISDSGFPSLINTDSKAVRLFFESGSTIAYVIGRYARCITNKEPYDFDIRSGAVLTNHLFALTALAGLIEDVTPVWGNLVPKYFGFFPSAEGERTPAADADTEPQKDRWLREIKGYIRLKEDIQECSHVLATCSNFSFLAGPLVGSRGNALAKHAIYTGRKSDAEFAVCFHFDKLIALHDAGPAKDKLDACYCVFPGLTNSAAVAKIRQSLNADNWHSKRWLRGPKTALGEFASADQKYSKKIDAATFESSWAAKARGMRMIIGLPDSETANDLKRTKLMNWFKRELDVANKLVREVHSIKYEINLDVSKQWPGVTEIRVVDA